MLQLCDDQSRFASREYADDSIASLVFAALIECFCGMRSLSEYHPHELTLYTGFARLSVSGGGVDSGGGGIGSNVSATAEVHFGGWNLSKFGSVGGACVRWGKFRNIGGKDGADSPDSVE